LNIKARRAWVARPAFVPEDTAVRSVREFQRPDREASYAPLAARYRLAAACSGGQALVLFGEGHPRSSVSDASM